MANLQAACEAAREKPQAEGQAEAVQDFAEMLEIPVEEAGAALASMESHQGVVRELLLRGFVEAWLEGQRKAYRHVQGLG